MRRYNRKFRVPPKGNSGYNENRISTAASRGYVVLPSLLHPRFSFTLEVNAVQCFTFSLFTDSSSLPGAAR